MFKDYLLAFFHKLQSRKKEYKNKIKRTTIAPISISFFIKQWKKK